MGKVKQGLKMKFAKNNKAKYRVTYTQKSYRKKTPNEEISSLSYSKTISKKSKLNY